MRRLVIVVMVFSVLNVCWRHNPASAWVTGAHQLIARDAITVLPTALKEVFESNSLRILDGVVAPDFDPNKAGEDHMIFLVPYRGRPPRPGGAAEMLDKFAKQTETLLKSGGDLGNALYALGQATHFVQDLNQPLHEVWWQTASEHAAIEDLMVYYTWQTEKKYEGFQLVKKYGCFAYEIARRASQYSLALINGSETDIKRITETTWHSAVNDTASFWQSVFVHALGAERAQTLYGIPAPVKEVGKGWLC